MYLLQLTHLPVLLACYSDRILAETKAIPDARLHEYWLASRMLMFRWCQQLRKLKSSMEEGPDREKAWTQSTRVLREALIHELTARLCSAILEGLDEQCGGR